MRIKDKEVVTQLYFWLHGGPKARVEKPTQRLILAQNYLKITRSTHKLSMTTFCFVLMLIVDSEQA